MSVEGQSAVLEVFYKRSKAGVKGTEAWRSCPGRGGKEDGNVERALVCIGMERVCREQLPGRPGSARNPYSGPEGFIPGLWVPAAS